MWTIIGVGVVVLAIVNLPALKKIYRAFRSQVGKLGSAVGGADPVANLNQVIRDESQKLGLAKQGLAKVEEVRLQLARLITEDEKDLLKLEGRIKLAKTNGDTTNALNFAQSYSTVEQSLIKRREQLKTNQAKLENYTEKIKSADQTLQNARERAKTLSVDLTVAEKTASLTTLTSTFNLDVDNSISENEALVQSRIDSYQATENVSEALDNRAERTYDALEKEAAAKAVLERFA